MGEVVKFDNPDPKSWTVEEALERAMETVTSGKFKADKVFVALTMSAKEGKPAKIYYTVAGMDLPECLGWLAIHKHSLLSDLD